MGQHPKSEPAGMDDLPRGPQRDREAGRPVRSSDDDPRADAERSGPASRRVEEDGIPSVDPRGDGPRDASPADPDPAAATSEHATLGDTAYGSAVE